MTNAPDRSDSGAFWLWVDSRGHSDLRAALERAIALFRVKERWDGQEPNAIKAHPQLARDGLGPVARSLGLRVIDDPRVTAGTIMLGIMGEEEVIE